jgi:rhamnosyl/mannosyltransferase
MAGEWWRFTRRYSKKGWRAMRTDALPRGAAPRRVLQVGKYYAPYPGGIESHLQSLCEQLVGRVDLSVLVSNDGTDSVVETVNGVSVRRFGRSMTLAGAPICPGMIRAIAESDADIIHLHLPNPAAALAYLASGHRGRLVVSYHSDVVRQRFLGAAFAPFLQWVLRRAEAILVATPNYLHSSPALARHRDRCVVIPYGISDSDFKASDAEVDAIRKKYGGRIVLSVGRLVYYKGFEHVIDAMREIDGHLLIVGDGPLRQELEARARSQKVAGRITFLGKVERTAAFYHAADVFVLASVARSEAFGIVQLEAMACGTPVVNTRLESGVPYVSRHEETGITVPPGNAGALARAVNRILDDEVLRNAYGSAARNRVRDEFDQEHMGERMLELYELLLSAVPTDVRGAVALHPRVDCAL